MIPKARAKLLLGLFTTILALDVISKWLVDKFLPLMQRNLMPYPYGGLALFENFHGISASINHQTNTGAAWGIFPNSTQTLFYVRLAIIGALVIYVLFFNPNRKSQIPFALILSGAVGNVLDTLFYGHVIDLFFVQLWGYDFPVFNIADAFIFFGVAWLCLINIQKDSKSKTPAPIPKSHDPNPPPSEF